MSDSGTLLTRITALRKRLEETPSLAPPEGVAPAPEGAAATPAGLGAAVRAGERQQALVERGLRRLSGAEREGETILPAQLTARARRLLEETRSLITELRELGADPLLAAPGDPPPRPAEPPDPLAQAYHELVAMTETGLRLVQAFPDAPSEQLRLCDGLEGILGAVRERTRGLGDALARRRHDAAQVDRLGQFLAALDGGHRPEMKALEELCDALLEESAEPLRFLSAPPGESQAFPGSAAFAPPVRFVACHGLTVARVLARLVGRDPLWRSRPREPLLAALLHDVGMLRVPLEVLAKPGPLDDGQRRAVEAHARVGTEAVLAHMPAPGAVLEAVAQHHERLDGTGYPAGLKGEQIAPLARLLAVVDVYAALASPRPHREALDPRTALTDTLLLAENGALDRGAAELLLRLSFYPAGSVVELTDGSVGVVIANPFGGAEQASPARPVVGLLTDRGGNLLPGPRYLDLSTTESGGVVRTLPRDQQRQLLGKRYPDLA